MRASHTLAAGIAACCAALMIVGCGAGQITQTDHEIAAVDGAFGDIGTSIALRNVMIPYPRNPAGTYPSGSSVPVSLAVVNQGSSPDELIGVSSPAASQVLVMGTTQIPPGTTVLGTASGAPGPSAQPTSPLIVGELRVLLTNAQPLRAGLNVPMTFEFRNAGKLTLSVPMATPPAPTS